MIKLLQQKYCIKLYHWPWPEIVQEIFYVLTGALVLFCLLELAWPRLVLAYLNLNLLLVIWLIFGIILLIINKKTL